MDKKPELDVTKIGASWGADAASPTILREDMALEPGVTTDIPTLDQALDIWWALHNEAGGTPEWATFKPFKYPALLPNTMTYEKKDGRFRCGLVGEAVREDLTIKIAGSFIDETMPPQNLADITTRLEQALQTGKPNYVVKTMAWQRGYSAKCYSGLQLPFLGKDGTPSRIMSVMSFKVKAA